MPAFFMWRTIKFIWDGVPMKKSKGFLNPCYALVKTLSECTDSDGNRTRVTAVKGRCLNRLTTEPQVDFRQLPE